jgi:hypothetical protein
MAPSALAATNRSGRHRLASGLWPRERSTQWTTSTVAALSLSTGDPSGRSTERLWRLDTPLSAPLHRWKPDASGHVRVHHQTATLFALRRWGDRIDRDQALVGATGRVASPLTSLRRRTGLCNQRVIIDHQCFHSPICFPTSDDHTSFPGPKHPLARGWAKRRKSLGHRHFHDHVAVFCDLTDETSG